MYFMWNSQTLKDILVNKVYGFWDTMCYGVHVIGFYLYSSNFTDFMPWFIFLIIWILCDMCMWHFLETRDWFYPVDISRDFLETSVDYYSIAHSTHLDVHIRVLRITISSSPRENSNSLLLATKRLMKPWIKAYVQ